MYVPLKFYHLLWFGFCRIIIKKKRSVYEVHEHMEGAKMVHVQQDNKYIIISYRVIVFIIKHESVWTL